MTVSTPENAASTQRIAIAMSGGVDSSLAVALLREAGHDVFGIHLRTFDPETVADDVSAPGDDARRVAEELGVEFHLLDVRDSFNQHVIAPFIEEYLRGRTPNPCVMCNPAIKFGVLLEHALELGADALATGHYARVDRVGSRCRLRRGLAEGKDQSYYLAMLRQEQLARFMAPLGALDKSQVRAMARARGLVVAEKEESQDVCFIPDGDYKRFIVDRVGDRLPGPGEIVDGDGKAIGRHDGAWRYTIGQRRGLGIAAPEPLYVIAIDMARNRVVVGTKSATLSNTLIAHGVNYVSIDPLTEPRKCEVQIRYRSRPSPALATPLEDGALRIEFDEPQSAITPGQTAALYDGDTLLAGAWIGET